jgi:HEXXH motif-containing protein
VNADLLRLAPEHIDAVAAGRPGTDALDVLRAGQIMKRRLLLRALHETLSLAGKSDVDDAFALLERADAGAPGVVDELIARPLVDAWAARCLAGIRHRGWSDPGVAADIAFLRSMAAAAGARAGLDFELRVPTPEGRLFLPGLGGAAGLGGPTALVRGSGGAFEVVGYGATAAPGRDGWRSTHALAVAGPVPWRLGVEDQDPYRDCFGYDPADYLSPSALAGLAARLDAAWQLVVTDHPDHAAVIRYTLSALVPLADPSGEQPVAGARQVALSASSQLAYGSVAVLVPEEPATLAMLLIHEVQHMTLSAVLDLEDLYLDGGAARHHAPWRLDPRPVGPLLQGTFAHLGVTDFWRAQRHREVGTARDQADFEFAYWRELTTRAIGTLAESGELTDAGTRFVDGLATTMDGRWGDHVPATILAAARDVADADTVLWRVRNQEPAAAALVDLDRLRRDGGACRGIGEPSIRPHPATPARRRGLAAGIRDQLLAADPAGHPDDGAPGDRAYLDGDLAAAVEGYRARIAADPGDEDAWVGLAMSVRASGDEPTAMVLHQRPDLVRALYETTVDDRAATTPDELADWLSTGLVGEVRKAEDQGDGGSM